MSSTLFRPRAIRVARVPLLVASALIAAACGGGSSEPVTPAKDVTPATITSDLTGTLTGVAGTQLNTVLSVTVKNKAGDLLDTIPVTFAVASGGGTVSNTVVKTTAGKATTTWTLGPAVGTQTVTATVGTLAPVTFTATATAGAAKNLTKNSTDPQTAIAGATVPVAPSVKVTDANNNPVANVLVTFAVAGGGGSVTGGLANTDANGVATVGSWKLGGPAGANTLTATAAGITTPVTFTATGTVGPVATVAFTTTAPASLFPGQTYTPAVRITDANGNVVTGATVAYSIDNASVASVNATTGVVTAVGGGTATLTATSAGKTATQTISVIGHPGTTVAASLAMGSRVRDVVANATTGYAALSSTSSVTAIDLASATAPWTVAMGGAVVDVAANAANSVVVAAAANSQLYIINPATHAVVDSVALSAPAVRVVMNSAGTRAAVDENNFQLELIDVGSRTVVSGVSLPGTMNAMKMAPGDTTFFTGTTLGVVYEVSLSSGAVKRTFQPSTTVTDLSVSPDGKTLAVADGSANVTLVRLATGGLPNQTVNFGANVSGVAWTPDGTQLWITMSNVLYAAPVEGTSLNPNLVPGRITVAGTVLTRIAFSPNGSAALVIDDAGNQVIVIK